MNICAPLCSALLLAMTAELARAQTPPANDDFADAVALSGARISFETSNTNAGVEPDEPTHAGSSGASIWYRFFLFEPYCDGICPAPDMVDVAFSLEGSGFDTVIAVYTGTSLDNLTQIASNDDIDGATLTSRVEVSLATGAPYFVAIDGKAGATGPVSFSAEIINPPAGDDFADPVALAGALSGADANWLVGASTQPGEPDLGEASIWYRWTAPTSEDYSVFTDGSKGSVTLGVFQGESVSTLTELARSTDTRTNLLVPESVAPQLSFSAVADQTYYFGLGAESAASAGMTHISWAPTNTQTTLFSAVLPSARSVRVGTTATALMSVINAGASPATNCFITPPAQTPFNVTLQGQTTDPATNLVDQPLGAPVDIAAQESQSFLLTATPFAHTNGLEFAPIIRCDNAAAPTGLSGVNTLTLSAGEDTPPDLIAINATLRPDGIVAVPGSMGTEVFTIASVNIGTAGTINITPEVGDLPLSASLCETDESGTCFASPSTGATRDYNPGDVGFFSVFVQGQGEEVGFDPANNRVRVVFTDTATDTQVGGTSVAVTAQDPNENAPEFTSANSAVIAENEIAAYTASATDADGDPVTFEIVGGADAARFTLNAITGQLNFKTAPDFEAISDANTDRIYEVLIRASDGLNATDQAVTIQVTNVNEPPILLSDTQITVVEGNREVGRIEVNDPETGLEFLLTIVGGPDADKLFIPNDSAPGEPTNILTFNAVPDFENPGDADGDNVYELTLSISDYTNEILEDFVITVVDSSITIDVGELGADPGFYVVGEDSLSQAASPVSLGDINGDGFDDFATDTDDFGQNTTSSLVLFGGFSDFDTDFSGRRVLDTEIFPLQAGFEIISSEGRASTVSAGDFNADGHADLLVINKTKAVIVYGPVSDVGEAGQLRRQLDLETLGPDDALVMVFDTQKPSQTLHAASVGDVNGDTVDDIIITDRFADQAGLVNSGLAYIVYGSAAPLGQIVGDQRELDLSNLQSGEGAILEGSAEVYQLGRDAVGLGDINDDGFDDIAMRVRRNGEDEGLVLYGSDTGFGTEQNGQDRLILPGATPQQGFVVETASRLTSLSAGGDFNDDGLEDFLVTLSTVGSDQSDWPTACLIAGSASGLGSEVAGEQRLVVDTVSPAESRCFAGPDLRVGIAIGDANNDGVSDLLLADAFSDFFAYQSGVGFVVFGSAAPKGEVIEGRLVLNLTTMDGDEGLVLRPETLGVDDNIAPEDGGRLGSGLAGPIDVNGDMIMDIVIGASGEPGSHPIETEAGRIYVIYGTEKFVVP